MTLIVKFVLVAIAALLSGTILILLLPVSHWPTIWVVFAVVCPMLFLVVALFVPGRLVWDLQVYCNKCEAFFLVGNLIKKTSKSGLPDLTCPSCHEVIARKSNAPKV